MFRYLVISAALISVASGVQAASLTSTIGAYSDYNYGDAGTFEYTLPAGAVVVDASVTLNNVFVYYNNAADFSLNGTFLGSQGFTEGTVDTFSVTNLSSLTDGSAVLSVTQDFFAGDPYQGFSGATLSIDYTGGVTAVPEPASWVAMIGGLGLVGAALRRRRNVGSLPVAV